MYDMYPEWGPAKHRHDEPESGAGVGATLDLRDDEGERPDDN